MPYQPLTWPRSGHAVNARNESADRFERIRAESAEIMAMVDDGEFTIADLLLSLGAIERWASDGLLILVEQGAPFRPPQELGKRKARRGTGLNRGGHRGSGDH